MYNFLNKLNLFTFTEKLQCKLKNIMIINIAFSRKMAPPYATLRKKLFFPNAMHKLYPLINSRRGSTTWENDDILKYFTTFCDKYNHNYNTFK